MRQLASDLTKMRFTRFKVRRWRTRKKKKENYNKTLPSCNATLVLFSSALLTFQFIIFKKIKNKTKKKKINILPPPPPPLFSRFHLFRIPFFFFFTSPPLSVLKIMSFYSSEILSRNFDRNLLFTVMVISVQPVFFSWTFGLTFSPSLLILFFFFSLAVNYNPHKKCHIDLLNSPPPIFSFP